MWRCQCRCWIEKTCADISLIGSVGGAACLGRKEVRAAAQQVLKKCHLAGENVEGGAEIAAATKGVFQGVRVIAATPEE